MSNKENNYFAPNALRITLNEQEIALSFGTIDVSGSGDNLNNADISDCVNIKFSPQSITGLIDSLIGAAQKYAELYHKDLLGIGPEKEVVDNAD